LNVGVADKGLTDHRGVDIDLEGGAAPGLEVPLEIGGNDDDEGVASLVQGPVHGGPGDGYGGLEEGGGQGPGHAQGKGGPVLIHHRHRGVPQFLGNPMGGGIDAPGKGPDNEDQQHLVGPQAAQFLEAQAVDVGQPVPGA